MRNLGNLIDEFIEINGKKYKIYIQEKDIENSYAKLKDNRILIVISSKLDKEERTRTVEILKKKIQKPRRTKFIEPEREFNDGDIIDLGKKKYKIKIEIIDKNSSSARLVGNVIHIRVGSSISDDVKKKHIYELARKIISQNRLPELRKKLKELNKHHFNATFKDVRWKKQISQWGSCSENKYINISYRLLFAPDEVLDYVCIHELAHLIEFNHSKRFWKLVSKAMPDYEEKEKWLKENSGEIY
ncbi:MAG: M48 family metallopeptidase [Candidatus Aenigmarchaeota archaeon]|nr:M48 family metallopeptidase [Candidatus Aenigmarchaeota archaeon]MDI6722397.1 M48 family metallopeptidase [Candidatus Aenigmarchaeota archaeon]